MQTPLVFMVNVLKSVPHAPQAAGLAVSGAHLPCVECPRDSLPYVNKHTWTQTSCDRVCKSCRTTNGQGSSGYPFLIRPYLLKNNVYIFMNVLTFPTHFAAPNLLKVWQKSIPLVAKTMWRKSRLISKRGIRF